MTPPTPPATPESGAAKGAVELVELERGERTLARRSAEIRATVPHLELTVAVDVGAALRRCEQEGVGLLAAVVRACALALRVVPRANGSYRGDWVELHSRINVGITVSSEDVHVIPTLFDADLKSLADVEAELAELTRRALSGELSPPDLAGATFTLVDAGAQGLLSAAPLVISPQAAALCAGVVQPVLRSGEGGIVSGHEMLLTLACDHRILYGAGAARFLTTVRSNLEQGQL